MKIFLLAFVMVTSAVVAGCSKSKSSSSESQTSTPSENLTPVKNDWKVSWLPANPELLNPMLATDAYSRGVTGSVFDSLLKWNPATGEPEGLIAESWTVSKDGLTYDFVIRKGITFHDGKPLTAEDVKFSFDLIKNPKIDAAHLQNYFSGLLSTEVVDPFKIRFKLKEVYYRNLIMLGLNDIMPKHIYGVGDFNAHPANRKPIGSGPYEFSKWETGRLIELKRFKNYFGNSVDSLKNLYNFDRLLFRVITEDQVALMALKKGDIDEMEPTSNQFNKEFKGPELEKKFYKLKYETQDGAGYGFIGWNLRLPLFQSKEVRQALALAMPREEINKKVFDGFRTLAVGPFPKASPKTDLSIQPISYDIEKAKQLFAAAGWKQNSKGILEKEGKPFSFELLFTASNSDAERVALIYQQALKQIGIEMRLRTLEWTVFLKQIQSQKFDSVFLSWGASLDSDPYQIWHSSQAVAGGSNQVGYNNPKVDKLLEEARRTLDREKRNEMYREFTKIVADDAPYLFLFERPNLFIGTKRFENVLPVQKLGLDSAAWFTPKGREKYHEAAN